MARINFLIQWFGQKGVVIRKIEGPMVMVIWASFGRNECKTLLLHSAKKKIEMYIIQEHRFYTAILIQRLALSSLARTPSSFSELYYHFEAFEDIFADFGPDFNFNWSN